MQNYLITGCAGFIGSHVSELLLKRGDRVIGIDNLNDYYPVSLKHNNLNDLKRHKQFTFFEGDICDFPLLKKIFEENQIEKIAHIAARAGVRPSIQNPWIYEKTNVEGTLNLLEVARSNKIKNFVLTSSSSVYGNSTKIPFQENDSATDTPISQYAASKKATEVLAHTYHHLYGLNVNIVRPFTVYGPRGRPDMAPWIFLESALKGTPIKKFGDGTTRRDYTFITDFAHGFVSALDNTFGYEIFNLGNSQTVSLNEAIETIEQVTGKKLIIKQEPMQPGDVQMTNADISKAKRMLGYSPKTSFKDGMQAFYEWWNR